MGSAISNFMGALKNGGARPNRFEVLITPPAFASVSEAIAKTPYLVTATSLPASNLATIEQNFRGRSIKMAGDRSFDDWDCTFVNDTSFDIHDMFELWHNGINAYNSNIGLQIPNDYMGTCSVYQLDNQDNRVKEVVMLYAWPNKVGAITLDQATSTSLETFDITFSYSDIQNGNNT